MFRHREGIFDFVVGRASLKGLTLLVLAVAAPAVAVRAQKSHPPHWSYDGKEGPEKWGVLDPAYATCSRGRAQSPIDIDHAVKADLHPLRFDYKASPLNIIDNGHTIQVNYSPGSTLTVGDRVYTLKQFHFHHPSEEQVNGRTFDLVAHLVHDDGAAHLAVVAVLFKTGSSNTALETIWKSTPAEKEKAISVPAVSLNAKDLLPPDQGYYTFSGSLTTPPCTEGVAWYVLKNQSFLSVDQVTAFARIYPSNARPVQPSNGREILETK